MKEHMFWSAEQLHGWQLKEVGDSLCFLISRFNRDTAPENANIDFMSWTVYTDARTCRLFILDCLSADTPAWKETTAFPSEHRGP